MTDERVFPLLPTDQRYWSKMERSRSRDPPAFDDRPLDPESAEIAEAAQRALGRYLIRPRGWSPDPPPPHARASLRLRLRGKLSDRQYDGLCLFLAAGWLPIGIILCLVLRPGITGRQLRARQVTPADLRRTLAADQLRLRWVWLRMTM